MRAGDNSRFSISHGIVTGDNNTIFGNKNVINGDCNKIFGDDNVINGDNSKVVGDRNVANGDCNRLKGSNNIANGDNNKIKDRGGVGDAVDVTHLVNNFGRNNAQSRGGGQYAVGVNNVVQINDDSRQPGQRSKQLIDYWKKLKGKKREREEVQYIEVPTEEEAREHDAPLDDNPENAPECRICMDRKPLCAILPCMHQCLCCACARTIAADGTKEQGSVECPICKAKIEKIKRIFI